MKSFRSLVVMAVTCSLPALAQSAATPVVPQSQAELASISCPAGTAQVGGARTALGVKGCLKGMSGGARVYEGPFVAFREDGTVEGRGQFLNGFRHGRWSFFDSAGRKTGETEFVRNVYHGARIQYFADGRIRSRENWVNGKREGIQESFDEAGRKQSIEYRNDAPVMASR